MTVRVNATFWPPTTVPSRGALVDFRMLGAGSTTSTRELADEVRAVPPESAGVELKVAVLVRCTPWTFVVSMARTRALMVIRNSWAVVVALL